MFTFILKLVNIIKWFMWIYMEKCFKYEFCIRFLWGVLLKAINYFLSLIFHFFT